MINVSLINAYEAEQFIGYRVDEFEVSYDMNQAPSITINTVTASIGDWIVKHTVSDGQNEKNRVFSLVRCFI